MTIITVTIRIKSVSRDKEYNKRDGSIAYYKHTEAKIDTNEICIYITECDQINTCKTRHLLTNSEESILDKIKSELYSDNSNTINNIQNIVSQSMVGKIREILDDNYDNDEKKYQIGKIIDDIESTNIARDHYPLMNTFSKIADDTYEAKLHVDNIFAWQPLCITISRYYMDEYQWGNTTSDIDTPVELTMYHPRDDNDLFKYHNGYILFKKKLYDSGYVFDGRENY